MWDGELQENVLEVEGDNIVDAVDISPNSTRFATGTRAKEASIWSISSGQRLIGPLKHDNWVTGIRFSPDSDRIATACCWGHSVNILDSHTGANLVTINTDLPGACTITSLAWLGDGQQIFAVSSNKKVRAFDTSSGTQLAESQIPNDSHATVNSIVLATNSKFIATCAGYSIWFLDTSTLGRIGPVIEDGEGLWSLAISPDSSHLAIGRWDGKIVIRELGNILPDVYGPFNVSNCPLHVE